MQIVHDARELGTSGSRVCVAIGMFDGVHLGHQQVIRQTVADAARAEGRSVVVTFDRHPSSVVAPERAPTLIYSLPQRLRAIAEIGVQAACVVPFDRAFSELPAEDFVRGFIRDAGQLHSVCVGTAFAFGHRRAGNVALLRRLGDELEFVVHGLAAVAVSGRVVSSTRIREAIRSGDLDAASQMLGRPYGLAGVVRRGDQRGRQLGYPTANLDVRGIELPPHGVYVAHAFVSGASHRAVVNIGLRPTIATGGADGAQVEAHLLRFDGDLYGAELELTLGQRLREERRFGSLQELKQQIASDIVTAEAVFA
jgi:riboflavin kinase/FMN adenylyltransferase